MYSSDSIKTKLLEHWLQSEREQYVRLTENRHDLGNKAQGNVTIAGIFIAVGSAWVKDVIEKNITLSCFEKTELVIATMFFLLSVLISVFVLFVRAIPAPREEHLVGQILKLSESDLTTERLHPLLYDLSNHWKIVNNDLEVCNDKKSYWLFSAQIFISLGISLIALIAIIRIINY